METLSLPQLIHSLQANSLDSAWIDVRSEFEFAKAAIPGTHNLPLLVQSERHEIGLVYKQQGQEAAIKLGEQLVGPHQTARVAGWVQCIQNSATRTGIIMCWRGGMRSDISCHWLKEAGQSVRQVEGGYKAIRRQFLQILEQPPPMIVLQGLTGSGKTELLRTLPQAHIDLEGAAQHRGSSFGSLLGQTQPAQATFENALALQILRGHSYQQPFLVEDESRMLGVLTIPKPILLVMEQAPVVLIEESLEARSARLYQEYIALPLSQGYCLDKLFDHALPAFLRIERRLDKDGGDIRRLLIEAFQSTGNEDKDLAWIGAMLELYYDKRYHYSASKRSRNLLFVGNLQACREWLIDHHSSRLGDL